MKTQLFSESLTTFTSNIRELQPQLQWPDGRKFNSVTGECNWCGSTRWQTFWPKRQVDRKISGLPISRKPETNCSSALSLRLTRIITPRSSSLLAFFIRELSRAIDSPPSIVSIFPTAVPSVDLRGDSRLRNSSSDRLRLGHNTPVYSIASL